MHEHYTQTFDIYDILNPVQMHCQCVYSAVMVNSKLDYSVIDGHDTIIDS